MTSIDRNIHPLKILSASAGSGKTHQLVLEYLTILLKDVHFKRKYKSIVAMTFTNKAASEMKERILSTLFGIAYEDPKNTKIAQMKLDLVRETGLSAEELAKRSKLALEGILHAYEDFHVSTIDKFNLRLIRSFSRDLDLPADFEVILNEKQVTEDVVDLLMNQLGALGYEDLSEWMFQYAKANLEEGNSWNFRHQLVQFSSILSQERNADLIEHLLQLELTKDNYHRLIEDRNQLVKSIADESKRLHDAFFALGLDESEVPGKSQTVNALRKLNVSNELPPLNSKGDALFSDTFVKHMEPGSKMPIPDQMKHDFLALNEGFMEEYAKFNLMELYRKNFFNMALLQYVGKQLKSMMNDEQLIRISEFNKLISKLVRDEEAPYIYERLGVRFEHFLLDEFQDTSRLQWLNLIPLLLESLGHNRWNLIVGDAKQSIYRFNNGLAEQFVSLPAIYNPENDPQLAHKSANLAFRGMKKNLHSNFRSSPVIVEFNNQLFEALRQKLPPSMAHFYEGLTQKPEKNKQGYIRIESKNTKLEFDERLEKIIGFIEQCLADGFQAGDICILTETNRLGNDIAIGLTERKYQVVSQDSLLVYKDTRVQLILSYLKRRAAPKKSSETKRFAELFFRMHETLNTSDYLAYFEQIVTPEKTTRFFNDKRFLAEHFGGESTFFTSYESVYDLVQKFMLLMGWKETKEPYLHHFMDVIYSFQLSRQADIHHFLEYFEAQKDKLALQMPDTQAAIKIMTIHKSKGLEFPVVIMPSMDFTIALNSSSKFLFEARDKIVYAFPAQKLKVPEIDAFAKTESNAVLLDKMNLFYVAMTRPELRLYALNDYDPKKFGGLIHEELSSLFPNMDEDGLLEVGEAGPIVTKESEKSVLYEPTDFTNCLWYPDIVFRKVQREESEEQMEEQRFGNDFHLLMSKCATSLDVDVVLSQLLSEGLIEEKNEVSLRAIAHAFWQKMEEGQYLEGNEKILNEQLILAGENEGKKPDKVFIKTNEVLVVDFKTGKIDQQHMEQIVAYGNLLEEIYKKPSRCLLYYSALNQLTEL